MSDPKRTITLSDVRFHEFVPAEVQPYAYLDTPLPIGFGETISQPFMVAVMTDLLELKPDDIVLEIGTGLGYQSAVLAELAGEVCSVEIIDELAQRAIQGLKRQGYKNVEVHVANGYLGWPEHAPFDKVIVTAAPDLIPTPLINQLKAGGRMVIPVGLLGAQQLVVAVKDPNGRVRYERNHACTVFRAQGDPSNQRSARPDQTILGIAIQRDYQKEATVR
jgi:protein-L-isoaspartate(D-aspartate) O-methyltransferase